MSAVLEALSKVDAALAQLADAVAAMGDADFLRAHQAAHDEPQRPAVDLVAGVFEAEYWRRWPDGREDADTPDDLQADNVQRAAERLQQTAWPTNDDSQLRERAASIVDTLAAVARERPLAVLMEPEDLISLGEATQIAGRSDAVVRRWCRSNGIGRSIGQGSRLQVSRPALLALMARDFDAIERLRSGERDHPSVARYLAA